MMRIFVKFSFSLCRLIFENRNQEMQSSSAQILFQVHVLHIHLKTFSQEKFLDLCVSFSISEIRPHVTCGHKTNNLNAMGDLKLK